MSQKFKLVALFVIGVGLLFPFDHTLTLLSGVLFLVAFAVYGTFVVAEPEFLSRDGGAENDDAAAEQSEG